METIYWIQRLGALNTLCACVLALCFIAIVALLIYRNVELDSDYSSDKTKIVVMWKNVRIFAVIAAVSALGCVFVPTTKEMYMIYGVGGTIDYLKENETAKQLPDKVVMALDKWVDSQIEDENEDKDK